MIVFVFLFFSVYLANNNLEDNESQNRTDFASILQPWRKKKILI